VPSVEIQPTFERNISQAELATCFKLVSFLAYSSTLKMEAKGSSEMSVDFQRTTRRYTPEDRTLHEEHIVTGRLEGGIAEPVKQS
jgi:hypothetical protein